ncbi:Phosphodiesterase, MJ0936 family [Desulfonema magnum]|uniref:Phosphoesterase n=1 Tax=Desulfonema magnum TaxID=45655 RepID=A0A975BK35_9BACT|nr:Phosphodiesterase, MJ0936 family [Desulfonema magnum]
MAVMSDSHDNIWNMRKALAVIKKRNAAIIIHCGDFVAPFMLKELEQAQIPVHGVFGNNDGERHLLTQFSLTTFSHITLHGRMAGEVELDGFKIGFAHEPVIADGLLYRKKYDMVCFGHSHTYTEERIGQTLLLNPGEIMGKDGRPGFALVNIVTGKCEHILI